MDSNTPKLIEGGVFNDHRGLVEFVNDFDMTHVKRMYFTTHSSIDTIRAWQGHKIESRWFFCVKGSFLVKLIQINDWENPSPNFVCFEYKLTAKQPQVLYIPNGFVNGFKAIEIDSKLMIMSDYSLNEIENDEFRYDAKKWNKWNT